MKNKRDLLDFLILLFSFIFASSFPFSMIIKNNDLLVLIFQIIFQIGYIVFAIFFLKKSNLVTSFGKFKIKKFLIFLPSIIVCGSNFFYLWYIHGFATFKVEATFFLKIVLMIFSVANEEFLFRVLLLNNLTETKPLKKIIISSAIFGICHITVFLSTFNFGDLINILYTFGTGIIFGLIYVYSGGFVGAYIFHFLFNLFNNLIYSSMNPTFNFWPFMIANCIVGLVVGSYLLIIYLTVLKKKNI